MDKRKLILGIVLFGSIWGGMEAIVTSNMGGIGTLIPRSVVLALIALVVLSYARFALPKKGTTLAIGLIAAGFKFLGLPMLMGCQFAAVVGQAVILELAFSLAENRGWFHKPIPMTAVVIVSCFANFLTFSFSQAYIFGNHWWVDRGVSGLLEWSFTTGAVAALASAVGFALSLVLVKTSLSSFERFTEAQRPAFARSAIAVSACCWIIGAFLINEQLAGWL